MVPEEAVTLALRAARVYLNSLEHNDIESSSTWLVRGEGRSVLVWENRMCWCGRGGLCAGVGEEGCVLV